jgi:hypothetical protein
MKVPQDVVPTFFPEEFGTMKRLIMPALVLALVATPALAEAQGRGAGRGGMGGMMQNPVELILNRADSLELGLTAAEVTQLTTIRDELTAQNQPHQEAMQGLMATIQGGGGPPDPSVMAQMQEHMAPIQANNDAAVTRVRGILTAEQMVKIDAMLAAGRGGRMGGGGRGPGGGAAGGGTPG